MAQFFECFGCKNVILLSDATKKVCPGCGSANGQVISFERVKQGMDAGVFYNIDPRTRKPAKKKRQLRKIEKESPMRLPGLVKQEDVEIVSPEGELRCHVKGSFTGTMVLITDTSADVRVGDEIRRQLPNGKQEVFTVDDPTFYSSGPFGAHYQVKVSRPKVFDSHTGGHYSVSVSGSNARVNIHSNDHSVNLVSEGDLFSQMRQKVESGLSASAERDLLLDAIDRLESAKHDKGAFAGHYQGFIAAAAAHMTVIAPFLPALGELLAKMHS